MAVTALDKIACKMGKHKWKKAYVKDNKYEAYECEVCGIQKWHCDLTHIKPTEEIKRK